MNYWPDKLKKISAPNAGIAFMNLFFILLIIFMLSSNFVFLAGIRSKSIALPPLKAAEIKSAQKIIVSVSRKETEGANGKIISYEYAFNGENVQDAEALRPKLSEAIRLAGRQDNATKAPEEMMIVLMASKEIPYEKLIEFYALAKDYNVPLYLVTDDGNMDAVPRIMQQTNEIP